MSTTTPTGDGVNGPAGGCLTRRRLTRLANEFFGAFNSAEPRPVPAALAPPPDASSTARSRCPGTNLRELSEYHRAASVPGRLAALVAQQSPFAVPGLPPATAAAVRAVAQPGPWEPAFERPDGGPTGAPSFYFLDEGTVPGRPGTVAGRPGAVAMDNHPAFHVEAVRRDFPVLQERVHGRQLVWLDNAATTQKPQVVIDRLGLLLRARKLQYPPGAPTLWRRGRPMRTRGPGHRGPLPSARHRPPTSSSPAGPPRPSTWFPRRGAASASARAMRSWSRTSSTTPTSCRGSSWRR